MPVERMLRAAHEQETAPGQGKHQQKKDLDGLDDCYRNVHEGSDAERKNAGNTDQSHNDFCDPHHLREMVDTSMPDCKGGGWGNQRQPW